MFYSFWYIGLGRIELPNSLLAIQFLDLFFIAKMKLFGVKDNILNATFSNELFIFLSFNPI